MSGPSFSSWWIENEAAWLRALGDPDVTADKLLEQFCGIGAGERKGDDDVSPEDVGCDG